MRTIALICCHNGDQYLEEQIDSILNQTIKLDLIVIDDYFSTDKTLDIIKQKTKEHPNIQFNSYNFALGPSHSFLNSIKSVKESQSNDYLLYLVDQDDVWFPNKNEDVLYEFYKNESAIIFHDVEIVNDNLLRIRKSYYGSYWKVARDLKLPNQLYSNCVIGHTCAISSSFLNLIDLKYDNRIPMHDWYIINEAIILNKKIIYINKALSLYRQHSNNILGASRKKSNKLFNYLERQSSLLKNYHNLLKEKYPDIVKFHSLDYSLTIIHYIRPLKKLILILLINLYIIYDKIRLPRRK